MSTTDGSAHRRLRLRLAYDLWLFVVPARRREQTDVPYDGCATVGHVVESFGVPLTEVGALWVDGTSATPALRPPPGATIEIDPVTRPQPMPAFCFLLDVHLGKLARRLRILGIDTAYRNDTADNELITWGRAEHRMLLTRDRALLCRRAVGTGAYVRGVHADDQLTDVLDRFAPPLRPWTRCTACNGELEPVAKRDIRHRLEPGTRRTYDTFGRCRACGRVYWHGAHTRHLDTIVRTAHSAHPAT